MILYNTSFFIEKSLEQEFIDFYEKHLLSLIQAESLFEKFAMFRITTQHDPEMAGYALHLYVRNREILGEYIERIQPEFAEVLSKRFGERVLSFSTEMEQI
ncbi:hypothetical protein HQ47_00695 [Porphyromonas macacae]|uniref:DUF4286 domain-containing protein n=1 Tax=Porphyromonas macacae TaxID=28115 RepID=A0A0A2EFV1_9PORP|nr:DUF4286 family protein [Porphyromonas macacae]KGN76340.1 hypothetical protein HQ47_00695 [Porphyromonas macacae]